jgi:hypothetical protein
VIKRSALAIAALMMYYAPQAHADLITELVLVANGGAATCIVDVDSTTPTSPTLSAGCTGLTATNDFAHGTLVVSGNWTGTTFTSVSVTSGGYLASGLPTVQTVADVNVTSTAGGTTFETFFTDAFIPVTGTSFEFQGTNNPDAQVSGSTVAADLTYDASNAIPATASPVCNIALTGFDLDSCTGPNPSPSDTEYSLTTHNIVTFVGASGGKVQTTLTTSIVGNVPEPASIFLLGTLITGLVGLRQRSKRS